MRKIILALALLASLPALAETVSWTRPTTYVDGTPLPASAITGFEIRCAASGLTCAPVTALGTATSVTVIVNVPPAGGTVCVEGRTLVGSLVSAYGGGSGAACKTFPATPPGPPGNITIAVVIGVNIAPVYTFANGVRNSPVAGFVDLGVPCIGKVQFTYRGKSWRKVSPSAVKWWATPQTANVAAACA